MRRTLNFLVVCALFAFPAMANLITNGSFETANAGFTAPGPAGEALAPGSTAMAGWTVLGPSPDIAWLPTGFAGIPAEDGNYFLDLTGYGYNNDGDGGVTQSVNLAAGNYALTFYIGSLDNDEPDSVFASAGNQSNVVFTDSDRGAGSHWNLETLNFNVATTGSVTITLAGDEAGTEAASPYIGLDNVDVELVSSATPEPAMSLPVFLVFGGLLLWSRKIRAPKTTN
jgi:hypothetical protein